jgi:hypothetical protein
MWKRHRQTAQDIQRRLKEVHGSRVVLVEETYVNTHGRSTFVDVDFGEFIAIVGNVLKGSGHPTRGMQNRRKTLLEKYGVDWNFKIPEVQAKKRQTLMEHYGVTNPFQSEVIKQQIRDDNIKKYGVPNSLQREDVKQKVMATNMERYGVAWTLADPKLQERIRQTNQERYGVDNPLQNREISLRALRTTKKLTLIRHWKTGEELVCTGSYEVAFVNWCNHQQIDFDWQIPIMTPFLTKVGKFSTYVIDAFIKDGEFVGTWIEVKGWFTNTRNREKWEWFHSQHPDTSQLWDKRVLTRMRLLVKGKPNPVYVA